MNEFERIKVQIAGHTVTVTSWWDASAGNWRASAPGCLHLLHNVRAGSIDGGSREQAVKRVMVALSQAFGPA